MLFTFFACAKKVTNLPADRQGKHSRPEASGLIRWQLTVEQLLGQNRR
jgi:hypothetical protein